MEHEAVFRNAQYDHLMSLLLARMCDIKNDIDARGVQASKLEKLMKLDPALLSHIEAKMIANCIKEGIKNLDDGDGGATAMRVLVQSAKRWPATIAASVEDCKQCTTDLQAYERHFGKHALEMSVSDAFGRVTIAQLQGATTFTFTPSRSPPAKAEPVKADSPVHAVEASSKASCKQKSSKTSSKQTASVQPSLVSDVTKEKLTRAMRATTGVPRQALALNNQL
jgi:hypothetical protein